MMVIDRRCYDDLVDHAQAGAPEEICGILGGTYGEDTSTVTTARRAANVSENPVTEYYMAPEEQLELLDAIEAEGLDVVGFYHSHPAGPTNPSETDADRATWPDYSYVIVALDGHPYVGSWRWNDETGAFVPEVVRVA